MLKKRLQHKGALLLSFCFLMLSLQGQAEWRLIDSLQVKGQLIAVDRLNQFYLLNEEDQLWKTSPKGDLQFQFSDNTLGPLTEIDVSNPFNILVFYRAYQIAKVLDRTLNPNIEFDFGNLNLFNVQSLVNGIDNTIWVYDQQEGKIFQLDENGNTLNQSQDLIFITGSRPDSCRLLFHKNKLWLQADGIGFLSFNAFGQYQRTFSWEPKAEQVQFWKDRLLFLSEKKWYVLDTLVWEAKEISFLPAETAGSKVFFNGDYIFVQRGEYIYRNK